MNIRDIFEKPIDRTIEGVIKADDVASLQLEAEEYVITNEVSKSLEHFLSAYNDYQGANGVWISGFFGSGKSHLLKMLSILLENREIAGKPALEYFSPKCHDAMLKADMKRAAAIPSKSILFNIDQKADTISKTEVDAVLAVFVKVFNETCGYYGKQGYVAQFERDLDNRGIYNEFKQAYRDLTGKTWEKGREEVILEKGNVARACSQVTGTKEEANKNIIDAYRQDYKLSIEDFAKQVNDYIERQQPGFRLNFFVDEVGQYIAGNVKLMTNLQTIAESLATKCNGRSWIVVTAQEDMITVLGETGKQLTNDFSKIQDRFRTRLKLTSQNVDEVIQKRLLEKNPQGKIFAGKIYEREKNNFGTLFDFTDGATVYRSYKDEEHFINCYPFIPYQFTLFQSSIENLSVHAAFEGRHSSVGERSMLGDFQKVVVEISDQEIGRLATFDRMFEGIRAFLKAGIQRSILTAENHIQSDFAIRVLKALFLVKYVRGFNATPHNLRVLLQETFEQDITKLRRDIEEALNLLELQTYIQRSGDVYEYLTDEEKDVEEEIKNTGVDSGDIAQTLDDILFTEILRDRKIRYDVTGQDFPFTRKLDDRVYGREQELTIHFVTPFGENIDNLTVLQANSMGRSELLIALPADSRLVSDLSHYKRTEKYIRQSRSSTTSDAVLSILESKARQNTDRLKLVQDRIRELIGTAKCFVTGDRIEISGEDPKTRIVKGFYELIVRTYPNLRMLKGTAFSEDHIKKYLEITKGSMFGGETTSLIESEQEVLAFIQSNKRLGVRTTVKNIEENFSKKPYGWYLAAIQCVVAMLAGRGKIEARADSNILEGASLERALRNTQGFGNLILNPQSDVKASDLRRLKDFFSEFFDRPASGNEAKALGSETRAAFEEMFVDLKELHAQVRQYPFLCALDKPIQVVPELAGKEYSFYFEGLFKQENDLLDMKEHIIAPVRAFMSGPNKMIYDEASKFLQSQGPNFSSIDSDNPSRLQDILSSPDCYKGTCMKEAKGLLDSLRKEIDNQVAREREKALDTVAQLQVRIKEMAEYSGLTKEQRKEIDQSFEQIGDYVQKQNLIAVIRDQTVKYETRDYSELLTKISGWTHHEGQEAVEYVLQADLNVRYDKPYLANAEDVEQYVDALKKAMLKAINANKRIRF